MTTMPEAPTTDRVRARRRVDALGIVGVVVAWAVILVVVGALALAVVVPRVGAATPYTILTSSMQPQLPPGTLVVAKPVAPAEIGVGTVITYQLRSGDPTVVTHRVVAQAFGPDGKPIFQTKGDRNDVPDDRWVMPVQVKGELWYSVPYLGRVNSLVPGESRELVGVIVAIGLAAYALAMFVGAARDRRRGRGSHERAAS